MNSLLKVAVLSLCIGASIGCGTKQNANAAAEAPPAPQVVRESNTDFVSVDKPEEYPIVTATKLSVASELNTTAAVTPDVSRQIPVISLASGRVVAIYAHLGDAVRKGQVLVKVQSPDISGAYHDYLKAIADEKLARVQLERSKDLKERGAIAQKDVEVAANAEEDAKVTVTNALEHLTELGALPDHPSDIIDIRAPISGVITAQNTTSAAGVGSENQLNLFTISDLSEVWINCDVYENDLALVKLGEHADIHLAAFPKTVLKGRIADIGPLLDPTIRSAKVRLAVPNPGILRPGMFATVTFHSLTTQVHAIVPANAVLHLHDREWVYAPVGGGKFKRLEVAAGKMLPDNQQELISGLAPGDKVVGNALSLQNTVEQ